MYQPKSALYYLSVGFSAIRCIENAIRKTNGDKSIQHVLDFPCGYGRVLRFLIVRFPEAKFTVSDIDSVALDFCRSVFSVQSVMSDRDFRLMALGGKFDLIWCGSLMTHLDEKDATNLLKFFHDHLNPGGLCMFTTHGKTTMEWIQGKRETYRLTETAQQKVLSEYKEKGYGYADYKNQHGYGISVVSHDHMLAIARSVGRWNETFYLERGLDNHQDVYGFTYDETGARVDG